jgi:hypothetical protein
MAVSVSAPSSRLAVGQPDVLAALERAAAELARSLASARA